MDWREFYESDEFSAYRQRMIDEIANYTYMMLFQSAGKTESLLMIRGALDMVYKIMQLPSRSTTDAKQQEKYHAMVHRDMVQISNKLVEKRVADKD